MRGASRLAIILAAVLMASSAHALGNAEEEAELARATTLSWSKDPALQREADELLTAFLSKHPVSAPARLQRARVRAWLLRITESALDYRAYLAGHPTDDAVTLELARTLSWSKDPAERNAAIPVFDAYLARRRGDLDAVLARARALSWAGRSKDAIDAFRTYLASKPDDAEAKMALADTLFGGKDPAGYREALVTYDAHLAQSPKDLEVRRRRAKLRTWLGMFREADDDYRICAELAPTDDAILLERANALFQSTKPEGSIPLFDRYLERHPTDQTARASRARALLWAGDYGRAESELDALRATNLPAPMRASIETDLARLYAQTSRRSDACDLLEAVLEREPANREAREELDRASIPLHSRVTPSFTFYLDKSNIAVLSTGLDGRIALTRNFGVLLSATGYSLGTTQETLLALRPSGGLWGHYKIFDAEAAVGPRFYEAFKPNYGLWAKIGASPVSQLRVEGSYQYDDIYFDMLQPASLSAGVRGHALFGTVDAQLPLRLRLTGRVGTRQLLPDNHSFDASGTLLFKVAGPLSVGYNGQYITWSDNDPSYWSPQAFAAHLGIVRVSQSLLGGRFGYDAQAVVGAAGERIKKAPEAGFGVSFGGSAAVSYEPHPHLVLRLGLQYSQTVRRVPKLAVGGTSVNGIDEEETQEAKYWWLAGTTSATVYF